MRMIDPSMRHTVIGASVQVRAEDGHATGLTDKEHRKYKGKCKE